MKQNFSAYDGQLLIDFMADDSILSLVSHWESNHKNKPCYRISSKEFVAGTTTCEMLFKDTDYVRIYIFMHSLPGMDYLISEDPEDDFTHFEKAAKLLVDMIGKQSVVINLISCSAGRGISENHFTKTKLSLASKLHKAIFLLSGIDFHVVARTVEVMTANERLFNRFLSILEPQAKPGTKSTKDIDPTKPDKDHYKQPGSKIIFSTKHNSQMKSDACVHSWKRKIYKTLNPLCDFIQEKQHHRPFFYRWLNSLDSQPIKNIQAYLIDKNLYFYKIYKEYNQTGYLSFFFQKNPIDELIRQGDELLKSKNTLHKRVFVRNL